MLYHVQGQATYCYTGGKTFQPELPTLVFIHGAQNDHSVWALQSRSLAHHGFNVLAIDLPGHGRSSGSALSSIEAMAQWLLALFDSAGVSSATLIGHSMGSLIALETARCAPQRIDKLALLGNAYPMKVADALLTMARDDEPAAIDLVNSWSHCTSTQQTAVPGFQLQGNARRLMQRMSAINPAQLFFTDFTACNQYQQGEAAANSILAQQIPTLFLIARQDRMTTPKASVGLRQIITHAQVVEIDHCGHSMMSEQPEAVLTSLTTFVKSPV